MKTTIASAALAASLAAVPAAADHTSASSSTTTTTAPVSGLLNVDVTTSVDEYDDTVDARVAAVQTAIGRAGAELRNVPQSQHAEYIRAIRQVRGDISSIARAQAKLDAATTTARRIDVQADVEAAFARIDVRLDHLRASIPALASTLSFDAQTRARAAETFDAGETIGGVQLSPRSAWSTTTMNRLSTLEDRIDRLEAYAPRVSVSSRSALRDAVYDLRADLRASARSLQSLDQTSTRSEWNRLHDQIEDMADHLTTDLDAAYARWGVR
jgi:hypothetical protein